MADPFAVCIKEEQRVNRNLLSIINLIITALVISLAFSIQPEQIIADKALPERF